MKRTLIITGIVAAVITLVLIIFNKVTSKDKSANIYAEAKRGLFEITVANSGELLAENSIDIKGPEISMGNQGQFRGGPGGGHGRMHAMDFEIQDIISEGTMVKKGDYIAQLDRTEYDNTLKDELENLTTLRANLEMKVLDTAVTLTDLRDEIKNQQFVVEEARITLAESKYEPPATIRQAEISLNKAQRGLEQLKKNYSLRKAQSLADITQTKQALNDGTELVAALQDFLAKFTIIAPSDGILIYKEDWNGTKRKAGSDINPFDRTVATLPDLTSMLSQTYINEIEVSKVKTGQKVIITIDALPSKSYTGIITNVANIGEVLPNSDAKMFEVIIKIDGTDMELRPSMTTWNKIIINTIADAVYIPTECVQTGADSVTFVYTKKGNKQVVLLGEMNDKNVVVTSGLEPGDAVYLIQPEEPWKFKLTGEELLSKL
ncbi:MAG: HlyD family efflux transporter periplasmic adaptor subunit [Bacteroidia bacterium]|nr:HlyD family efflux transporter periplasmic adaptor subunit [Bacteroidia bacterium]